MRFLVSQGEAEQADHVVYVGNVMVLRWMLVQLHVRAEDLKTLSGGFSSTDPGAD